MGRIYKKMVFCNAVILEMKILMYKFKKRFKTQVSEDCKETVKSKRVGKRIDLCCNSNIYHRSIFRVDSKIFVSFLSNCNNICLLKLIATFLT